MSSGYRHLTSPLWARRLPPCCDGLVAEALGSDGRKAGAAQVARLKLGSGVAAARANIVLSRSFLPWWNRTERKAVFATYVAQATKYNDESTSS